MTRARGIEPQELLTSIAVLDAALDAYAAELGTDFEGYRNHVYRVINLCAAQSSDARNQIEKVAIAAAFHDLGIWTAGTFDYLAPSVSLAAAYLTHIGRQQWSEDVAAMIWDHHKVSPHRGSAVSLVEPFRRADWIDVSRGVIHFGMPRELVRRLFATWPSAGFHTRLIRLELRRIWTHPWRPLPMFRL